MFQTTVQMLSSFGINAYHDQHTTAICLDHGNGQILKIPYSDLAQGPISMLLEQRQQIEMFMGVQPAPVWC